MDLDEVLSGYEDDKFYGAVLTRIKGEDVPDEIVRRTIITKMVNLCFKETYVWQEKQFLL